MGKEQIIGTLERLEGIAARYDDLIGREYDLTRRERKVAGSEQLREQFAEKEREGRLLNIGVIGRVKAGKSSLLNAVFFEGASILPKAATPMTASLTAMTHGDAFAATVEYYTSRDIDAIKAAHDEYKSRLDQAAARARKDIEERAQRRGEKLSPADIDAKALRRAKEEVSDERREACYGQYELMMKSGKIDEMRSRSDPRQNLDAPGRDALMAELNTYVGAEGPLMPFTKSAEIRMPLDGLRDIQVVDTPGINDPVPSRTERTMEYLRNCDVVFIVSPAGQFVSKEDMNLMDQLTSKEGVRELYLVASQVDNQLYGSEGEEAGWDLRKALASIRGQLSRQAVDTLRSLKAGSPEVGGQFDQIINGGADRVIVTSAICHGMNLRFGDRASWDKDMNHVWGLLTEKYPDYFRESAAPANLAQLSGVPAVTEKIAGARAAKDAIMARKRADYLAGQETAVAGFQKDFAAAVSAKIETVKSTDLETVRRRQKDTGALLSRGSGAIDEAFEDSVDDFKADLRETLSKMSRDLFAEARAGVNEAEQTKTKTWTSGWWLWKKERHQEVASVRAGAVASTLNDLVNDLQDKLIATAERKKAEWKKAMQRKVVSAVMEAVPDVDQIDIPALKTALRRMVNNLEIPSLDLSSHTFTSAARGALEGAEAEAFIDDARKHMDGLRGCFSEETEKFLAGVDAAARKEPLSGLIFADMKGQLETLEKELRDKQNTLDRLGKCLAEIQEAA